MKTFYIVVILGAMVSTALAQVSPEEHAAHHPQQAAQAEGAPPAGAALPAPKPAADLFQNMKTMQALMDRLEQTKDPAERKKLLAQHREAMREQLDSMRHMGCAMGATGNMKGEGGMMDGGMMKCHEMMQARMELMVGMMEQMMRHEDSQHSAR